MKYSHDFNLALATEDFPAEWVSSAISYRDLKKNIKRVRQELQEQGLDSGTLRRLSSTTGEDTQAARTGQFDPQLWVAVDAQTGNIQEAKMTAETRSYISRNSSFAELSTAAERSNSTSDAAQVKDGTEGGETSPNLHWKQVPLATMNEFFDSLDPALAKLDEVQSNETDRLKESIVQLGQEIERLTAPSSSESKKSKARADVETWRDIFALYVDSTVFFSTHEQDHGLRDYTKARQQMDLFSSDLAKQGLTQRFKNPQSRIAFDKFMNINTDILKVMRFQEINATAVQKILKKFDKQTALGAGKSYQVQQVSGPFAESIAKDLCAQVSSNLIARVPLLDDYICPICYALAWRPVRLGCCKSLFCIRCIIQLQKDAVEACPTCRTKTVMSADQCKQHTST